MERVYRLENERFRLENIVWGKSMECVYRLENERNNEVSPPKHRLNCCVMATCP